MRKSGCLLAGFAAALFSNGALAASFVIPLHYDDGAIYTGTMYFGVDPCASTCLLETDTFFGQTEMCGPPLWDPDIRWSDDPGCPEETNCFSTGLFANFKPDEANVTFAFVADSIRNMSWPTGLSDELSYANFRETIGFPDALNVDMLTTPAVSIPARNTRDVFEITITLRSPYGACVPETADEESVFEAAPETIAEEAGVESVPETPAEEMAPENPGEPVDEIADDVEGAENNDGGMEDGALGQEDAPELAPEGGDDTVAGETDKGGGCACALTHSTPGSGWAVLLLACVVLLCWGRRRGRNAHPTEHRNAPGYP